MTRHVWIIAIVYLVVLGGSPALAQLRQTGYLKASNPAPYAHFGEGGTQPGHTGQAVAISGDGDTIAVGAPHENSGATGINGSQTDHSADNAGAVYVYTRRGTDWVQEAYVKASNTGPGDGFGSSVVLSADGNTMAVAAQWEDSAAVGVNGDQADNSVAQAGAVYVFTRRRGTWRQEAYLKASNTGEAGETADGDQFGFSLAMSDDGNTVAAGAITEDSNATGIDGNQQDNSAMSAGAVYVFARRGARWAQQAYIKADTPPTFSGGDLFGFSVALDARGDTLAVGAYDEGGSSRAVDGPLDNQRGGSGAVYVYVRRGSAWRKQAYVKSSISEAGDSWGVSVALSDEGNTLAIGSADEDCLATGVTPPGCHDDQRADVSAGAVAVFVRTGAAWTQQAYLKSSNAGKQDWFGVRVALSGDGNLLAVAAPNEDSAARGIDASQQDDSADEAGAVYVFARSSGSWSQQHYVKAANNEAFDEFGASLAISRDAGTLVAGARGEDGAASGAGSTGDNSTAEAGAAYIFTR